MCESGKMVIDRGERDIMREREFTHLYESDKEREKNTERERERETDRQKKD